MTSSRVRFLFRLGRALMVMCALATLQAQAPPALPRRDAPQPRAAAGRIRGRVVAAGTSDPVRKALVTLSPAPDQPAVYTDAEGRFTFTGLAPGRYMLTASKAGYAPGRFGARRVDDRPAAVDVGASAVPVDVEIPLVRGAAISGRVVDAQQQPLVDLFVAAGNVIREGGGRRFAIVSWAQTDDRGDYRLGGLAEGRYVVIVAPAVVNAWDVDNPVVIFGGNDERTLPRTYYPGVTSLSRADAVVLNAADDVSGIDVMVQGAAPSSLTLHATNERGEPASGTFLIAPIPAASSFARSGAVRAGVGSIRLEAGEWSVRLRGPDGVASRDIAVDAGENELHLVVTRGVRLEGTVVIEGGGSLPPAAQIQAVPIGLTTSGAADLPGARIRIGADRRFVLDNLFGPRTFRLANAPGWTLTALIAGGRNLLEAPATFQGSATQTGVRAVVTRARARLAGRITSDGAPAAMTSVVVFPAERARWTLPSEWARWVKADQRGAFVVDDLPPGRYLAIALDDVAADEWASEESFARWQPLATPVTLTIATPVEIPLSLRSRP